MSAKPMFLVFGFTPASMRQVPEGTLVYVIRANPTRKKGRGGFEVFAGPCTAERAIPLSEEHAALAHARLTEAGYTRVTCVPVPSLASVRPF